MTVHGHALAAVEQAVAAGADGVEHCACLTESGLRVTAEVVEALARRQVAVCPTLGAFADAVIVGSALVAAAERGGSGRGARAGRRAGRRRAPGRGAPAGVTQPA